MKHVADLHLHTGAGDAGGDRQFFEGMMWIARTGAQWRHLPGAYGKWNSVFRRYRRCATSDMFDAMLETLAEVVERDRSADMIDGTVVRAHHCAIGEKGTQQTEALGRLRGGFSTKLHARCDARGRALAFVLTPGQAHDTQGFGPLTCMITDRIERLFNKLKNWRRVATRYGKTAQSCIGFVSLASVLLWLPFVRET